MLSALFAALTKKGGGQQGNPATQGPPQSEMLPSPAGDVSTPSPASPLFAALLAQAEQKQPSGPTKPAEPVADPNSPVIKSIRKAFGYPS